MGKKSDLPKLTPELHDLLEQWVDALADNLAEEEAGERMEERDLDHRRVEICMDLIAEAMTDGGEKMVGEGSLDPEDFGEDSGHEWTNDELIGSLKRIAVAAVIDR
jgi:hypothetical protein